MEAVITQKEDLVTRRKSSVRFTYEDYLQFPDDGKRFEIIDGELFMSPSPLTKHQQTLLDLAYGIESHLKKVRSGKLFVAPVDVVFSETDVVQPDILFVSNSRTSIITEKNITGAPDFIIEILSPSNSIMDLKRKRSLYERSGVKEYWIVDPGKETIQKLILQDQVYVEAGLYKKGDVIASDVVNEFSVDIIKVFE